MRHRESRSAFGRDIPNSRFRPRREAAPTPSRWPDGYATFSSILGRCDSRRGHLVKRDRRRYRYTEGGEELGRFWATCAPERRAERGSVRWPVPPTSAVAKDLRNNPPI